MIKAIKLMVRLKFSSNYLALVFYYGRTIEENIYKQLLQAFGRKKLTKNLEKLIKSAEPMFISIDVDENGNYAGINKEWLNDFISAIKSKLVD